jgi:hypothetical protein
MSRCITNLKAAGSSGRAGGVESYWWSLVRGCIPCGRREDADCEECITLYEREKKEEARRKEGRLAKEIRDAQPWR